MSIAKMSEHKRLAGFYREWEARKSRGADSQEDRAELAKAWGFSTPPPERMTVDELKEWARRANALADRQCPADTL